MPLKRQGWKYIGVWERSKNERLHFHGIFVIPQMIGKLETVTDYDTRNHKKQTILQNTHFAERYGRNDFKEICSFNLEVTVKYVIKYIEKSGEKLVYGGDLPEYIDCNILAEDVVCTMGKEDRKILLFDDFTCIDKDGVVRGKASSPDNGVKVVSATEYIPDSPEAIILESMLEGYAEYYSAELSQKVKRGMRETRSKGNFTGGFIIYGYKVENHKVVIDTEKAETVKFIFERYAMGVYVKDIIKALTAKGILNCGKPFARNTVYNILKNEKYSGMQDEYIKANSALTRLVKEQRQTENAIQNIMSAIECGGTSNTAMKRLRELETLAEELEKQIRIEKAQSAYKLSKQEITDFYKLGLEQSPQMLINLLIKQIQLFDDKMVIIYNSPKTLSLDESRGFSFYTDNVPYPIYIQNMKQPRMIDFQLIMRI